MYITIIATLPCYNTFAIMFLIQCFAIVHDPAHGCVIDGVALPLETWRIVLKIVHDWVHESVTAPVAFW